MPMSIRMVRSHLPRQYKYSFNIFFLIINLRFNNSGATCSPACPIHAYCTATDDCACVQGYTGATCSTPNQWVLPAGNTIDQYTLAVGNTSKFYFHPKNTIKLPFMTHLIKVTMIFSSTRLSQQILNPMEHCV